MIRLGFKTTLIATALLSSLIASNSQHMDIRSVILDDNPNNNTLEVINNFIQPLNQNPRVDNIDNKYTKSIKLNTRIGEMNIALNPPSLAEIKDDTRLGIRSSKQSEKQPNLKKDIRIGMKFNDAFNEVIEDQITLNSLAKLEPNLDDRGVQVLHPPIPSVIQKLADEPIPQSIRTIIDGELKCYRPVFSEGLGYVGLGGCDYEASYDVFYRISFKVNKVDICLTAPSSVMDGGTSWDYVYLRPCVLNNPNQQWIVTNMGFHTLDKRYRIKHFKGYLYISKNPKDYYDHYLSGRMNNWLKIVAKPESLSIRTTLAWDLWTPEKPYRYYLRNDISAEDAFPLYYNASHSSIAVYDSSDGSKYCLKSNTNIREDWNWASWDKCNDQDFKLNMSWNTNFFDGEGGALRDNNGHYLRLTRYGSNWGVPYTASPRLVDSETDHSPTSLFVMGEEFTRWQELVKGNYGDNLTFCPAPGISVVKMHSGLPVDFRITDEWMRRLYDIANSHRGPERGPGICGLCMLHTLQIIAELEHAYPGPPVPSGGYFFNTAPDTSPFISFQQRYPNLYAAVRDIMALYRVRLHPAENPDYRSARTLRITINAMLPQYRWTHSVTARNHTDMEALLLQMLRARPGTVFIAAISFTNEEGRRVGHMAPVISVNGGVHVIAVNTTNVSYESFRQHLRIRRTTQEILQELQLGPSVDSLTIFELGHEVSTPLNVSISNNNCTGDGQDRRGNRRDVLAGSINTCTTASKRCALPR